MANLARKAEKAKPGERDLRRLTVYVRPDQVKALKIRAVQQERDVSGLMRDLLAEYLKRS